MNQASSPFKIEDLPEYALLLQRRRRIIVPLSLLMLVAYYSFILLVAYYPAFMGRPLTGGGVTSVGLVFGLGLIILTFMVTAFYVWYANARIEPVLRSIHQKAGNHG